ncbi:5'-nucleotidase [Streptomyces sp. NPDC053431]|uniref:5'-nucleotidase n=1 Tax=Streptomyces sp. NPDC053431 TaxID=3365703 RepID=UPI0037CCE30D
MTSRFARRGLPVLLLSSLALTAVVPGGTAGADQADRTDPAPGLRTDPAPGLRTDPAPGLRTDPALGLGADLAPEDRVVGYIADDLPGRSSTLPETPLGSLIADAQAAAGQAYGADFALVNPGRMSADLRYGDGGAVTYADARHVQPSDAPLWVLPVTGEHLLAALRQQFTGENRASPRFLQLSAELSYAVDMSRTGADRVLADTVRVHGEPLDPAATYRVVLDESLADGGDGFTVFADVTAREGGVTSEVRALVAHLAATTAPDRPAGVPAPGRIRFVARGH